MARQLLEALVKAGLATHDKPVKKTRVVEDKELPPVFDAALLPQPTESAPGLTSLKEPDYVAPDQDNVERYRGTMHWMHKSIPVLEIHGKKNDLLTPDEISKMKRR